MLYIGTKTKHLKKVKDFSCEFAFRDAGRLIRAYSRPGVFSHRRVDVGARHLMNEMQIEPGARVLDIGCGSGTVALAAAFRADGVQVHAELLQDIRAIQVCLYSACAPVSYRISALATPAYGWPERHKFQLAGQDFEHWPCTKAVTAASVLGCIVRAR